MIAKCHLLPRVISRCTDIFKRHLSIYWISQGKLKLCDFSPDFFFLPHSQTAFGYRQRKLRSEANQLWLPSTTNAVCELVKEMRWCVTADIQQVNYLELSATSKSYSDEIQTNENARHGAKVNNPCISSLNQFGSLDSYAHKYFWKREILSGSRWSVSLLKCVSVTVHRFGNQISTAVDFWRLYGVHVTWTPLCLPHSSTYSPLLDDCRGLQASRSEEAPK